MLSLPTNDTLAIGTVRPALRASRMKAAHAAYAPTEMMASGFASCRIATWRSRLSVYFVPRV